MPQERKTSKQIVKEYFPGAEVQAIPAKPIAYGIMWNKVWLTLQANSFMPTYSTEEEAWDGCIKNKLFRERFLSVQQGKVIKFLNECDDAIPLFKPPIKDNECPSEPIFKDITIEEVSESFTQARDW